MAAKAVGMNASSHHSVLSEPLDLSMPTTPALGFGVRGGLPYEPLIAMPLAFVLAER